MDATENLITCRRPSERGMTLLEVVIALAIFSIGIMAVASLQVSSTNGDTRARLATEAATVAHDQAEKLLSMNLIYVQSVFSHLASSEVPDDDRFTYQQIDRFKRMAERIRQHSDHYIMLHILNSAGISRFPDSVA